jgi:hypothetical protein
MWFKLRLISREDCQHSTASPSVARCHPPPRCSKREWGLLVTHWPPTTPPCGSKRPHHLPPLPVATHHPAARNASRGLSTTTTPAVAPSAARKASRGLQHPPSPRLLLEKRATGSFVIHHPIHRSLRDRGAVHRHNTHCRPLCCSKSERLGLWSPTTPSTARFVSGGLSTATTPADAPSAARKASRGLQHPPSPHLLLEKRAAGSLVTHHPFCRHSLRERGLAIPPLRHPPLPRGFYFI